LKGTTADLSKHGFLINFNVKLLKQDIKSFVRETFMRFMFFMVQVVTLNEDKFG